MRGTQGGDRHTIIFAATPEGHLGTRDVITRVARDRSGEVDCCLSHERETRLTGAVSVRGAQYQVGLRTYPEIERGQGTSEAESTPKFLGSQWAGWSPLRAGTWWISETDIGEWRRWPCTTIPSSPRVDRRDAGQRSASCSWILCSVCISRSRHGTRERLALITGGLRARGGCDDGKSRRTTSYSETSELERPGRERLNGRIAMDGWTEGDAGYERLVTGEDFADIPPCTLVGLDLSVRFFGSTDSDSASFVELSPYTYLAPSIHTSNSSGLMRDEARSDGVWNDPPSFLSLEGWQSFLVCQKCLAPSSCFFFFWTPDPKTNTRELAAQVLDSR
ncbi:hypothetical protein C8R44DRAFT_747228 [Mycena epipterygia]|nr:hypothetical protein C8R44DRAFT_747228 [Mycena epipterygia]